MYVGSTRKTLSARLLSHQQGMRQWQRGGGRYVTSFALVGRPDVSIDLIEEEEYADLQHMRDREAYWIARSKRDAKPRKSASSIAKLSVCGTL